MTILDELSKLGSPVAGVAPQQNPNQAPSSWVKDLIDKRYQPQAERLKRSPVGFNFTREPFDPSSYYTSLNANKNISETATAVSTIEANNRASAQRDRDISANGAAVNGVNPNYSYNTTGASRKYGLKGVSPNVGHAADYWGSKYGIKTIGGRGPGSVPGSDHPKGRALDFMINNVKGGHARGEALANDVIRNYKSWNVKYVIWNRYIWSPGRGWRKYSGPSPHTDHVHVSFNK